jgi:D-alanyl-D-alanine carboxypeptidase/D-alanyl-D-alanine-endopeptidase (penicillin-binding protein 4)
MLLFFIRCFFKHQYILMVAQFLASHLYGGIALWQGVGVVLAGGAVLGGAEAAIAQVPGSGVAPRLCAAQLPGAINSVIGQPAFERSRWGVLVQTLGNRPATRQTLFAYDASKLFTPASNTKLLTTAAALHTLGGDYRIRTSVYQEGTETNTRLWIVGRGDPSLGMPQLQQLARQLQQQGIRQVATLIGQDGYFLGDAISPYWDWEDVQAGYGAAVNSLIYEQNAIDLTLFPQQVGQPLRVQWKYPSDASQWQVVNRSRTVDQQTEEFLKVNRDFATPTVVIEGQLQTGASPAAIAISAPAPGHRFLQQFRTALASAGIQVKQTQLTSTPLPPGLPEVATLESPSLIQLARVVNQESDNLAAEVLLKTLGRSQQPQTKSTEAGLNVLRTALTQLGVNPESYAIADGSGLARRNLVSPEALVQTLQNMYQTPAGQAYRASLSVAGVNGTLRSRFRNTPAAKIVQAKTGTLTGVTALSGYITPVNHPPLVFSIIVNHAVAPTLALRQAVDEIVLHLANLHRCEMTSLAHRSQQQ